MLDLPGHPVLDKQSLVGACLRLPLTVDVRRLAGEIAALPPDVWTGTGGRIGVHMAAKAVFLRGYAPAEGAKPIEDRPVLDSLPYARRLIEELIGGQPQRCLLARLPGGADVALHIDQAPYFSKTLRVHVPVETHAQAWMYCGGLSYCMKPGEAWVLNNSAVHGVWNADPARARTHLICDFLPGQGLLALLAAGEPNLGRVEPGVEQHLVAVTHRPRNVSG